MLMGMPNASERRSTPDRRHAPRGGRRPYDKPGTTPLVLVVGHGDPPQRESEAILHKLKFAVAPASDMAEARRVVDSLHPDLIAAPHEEAPQFEDTGLPVVGYGSGDAADGALVRHIRDAIRAHRRG
jgi:hypothetical protein